MKICLYSPYVPKHVGGGERYLFDVAVTLAKSNQVQVVISDDDPAFGELGQNWQEKIRSKYQDFLGYSLAEVNFIKGPIGSNASALKKLLWTKRWDLFYYLTDGSLFFSLAKKNILHIQFPLKINKTSPVEQMKLKNWGQKNTNSEFTKKIVESSWPVKIDQVHWPLIDVESELAGRKVPDKKKVILNVGRFFRHLHSKRQDVLVDVFSEMIKSKPKLMSGWKLVLVGSVEDQAYASEVKNKAKGLPIEVIHQVDRKDLLDWYAKAQVYWHATGFGVDEDSEPEKVEHFGISTVEAMSMGCAPVLVGKGGQVEIVKGGLEEYLWQTKEECSSLTLDLIENSRKLGEIQGKAVELSKKFGRDRYQKTLWQMIEAA